MFMETSQYVRSKMVLSQFEVDIESYLIKLKYLCLVTHFILECKSIFKNLNPHSGDS